VLDLVERIRNRPNDAPTPTERLLDEAADALERMHADRLRLDRRIHNQRKAYRETWETVEMRRKWLGSDTARKRIIWLSKHCKDLLMQLRAFQ
jgi:RecB family exonuclease